MRAVCLGHVVEHGDELLDQKLELAGTHLEPRHRKNADAGRNQKQRRRNRHRGNEARVDVHQAEETDLARFMQHGVAHRFLNRFRLGVSGNQKARDKQHQHKTDPGDQPFFPFFHNNHRALVLQGLSLLNEI